MTSAECMILPVLVSTKKKFAGPNTPFSITVLGSRSTTPDSEATTTKPSLVIEYREGRNPLRSRAAPTN